jgi:hypothetical protein
VIVAVGDSITDGLRSTANSNRRWPDFLARRLQAAGGANVRTGVVNRGVSSNRLLVATPPTCWPGAAWPIASIAMSLPRRASNA